MRRYIVGAPEERLWARVTPVDAEGCWEVDAARDKGYPVLRVGKANVRCSHLMWWWVYGEWPRGHVLHHCDNPACVRPDHLFTGSDLDNVVDKMEKGRQPDGRTMAHAKLTAEQVREIRALKAAGASYSDLMHRYPVSQYAIQRVVARQSYKWVD